MIAYGCYLFHMSVIWWIYWYCFLIHGFEYISFFLSATLKMAISSSFILLGCGLTPYRELYTVIYVWTTVIIDILFLLVTLSLPPSIISLCLDFLPPLYPSLRYVIFFMPSFLSIFSHFSSLLLYSCSVPPPFSSISSIAFQLHSTTSLRHFQFSEPYK